MEYQNKKNLRPTVNRQHPTATTGLDRPSTFYDRILAKEFREHFQFVYPDIENDEIKQDDNLVLKKRRIK